MNNSVHSRIFSVLFPQSVIGWQSLKDVNVGLEISQEIYLSISQGITYQQLLLHAKETNDESTWLDAHVLGLMGVSLDRRRWSILTNQNTSFTTDSRCQMGPRADLRWQWCYVKPKNTYIYIRLQSRAGWHTEYIHSMVYLLLIQKLG